MATTAEWPEPPGSTTVPPPPPPELDDELEPPEEEPPEDVSATAAALAAASAFALAAAAALAWRSAISSLSPPTVLSSWAWSASTSSLLSSRCATSLTADLRSASRARRRSAISWRYTSAACAVVASFSVMRCITSSCVSRSSKVCEAKTTSRMPVLSAM